MIDAVPEPLLPVLDAIDECIRTQRLGSWSLDQKGRWVLLFSAQLSVAASEFMPCESNWYLVVEQSQPRPIVNIYPATEGGITSTFPHQSANVAGPLGSPWRMGNPCLERPEVAFKRDQHAEEPIELSDRLIWRVGRLLDWIDAAASRSLLNPGDPLELPSFNYSSTPVLGFAETSENLSFWQDKIGQWGFATTSSLKGSLNHRRLTSFFTHEGELLKTEGISKDASIRKADAIWILLEGLPIVEPWQAPMSWRQLTEALTRLDVDLLHVMEQAGRQMRKSKSICTRLLLGFPLQQKVGNSPERVHWIAAENIGLSSNDRHRNGFRPIEKNRALWDASLGLSQTRVRWIKTSNWASDQLRTRGAAEDAVTTSRVLIIGAGAIGSAVAENLARSGVCHLGIIDGDSLEVGNLSRHTLGVSDCGHNKAHAVASRLANCGPDIESKPFNCTFPPKERSTVEAIQGYDVILDCTGSDAVLHAMASFNWKTEKVFISISIGWEAKQCFCFSASETSFPAIDALERFSKGMSNRPNMETANREGIGCWHPVFPANSDDIQLWSAIGTKFARKAIIDRHRSCKVYTISDNETVTFEDV